MYLWTCCVSGRRAPGDAGNDKAGDLHQGIQ